MGSGKIVLPNTLIFQLLWLDNFNNFGTVDKDELFENVNACYFIKFVTFINDTFCGITNFSAT